MSLMELELIEKLFTPEQTREIMSKLMDECDFVAAGVRGALSVRDRIAGAHASPTWGAKKDERSQRLV